jgi:hypothetical protein
VAIENWTSAAAGTRLDLLVTPAGGLTQSTAMSLLDSGRVLINTASDDGTSFLQVNGRALVGTIAIGASTPFSALGSGLSVASGTLSAAGGVGTIVAGTGLSGGTITSSGTVALATRTAHTMMGNPGTAAATPSDITIGTGLTLSTAGTLSVVGGSIAAKPQFQSVNPTINSTNSLSVNFVGCTFQPLESIVATGVFAYFNTIDSAGTYQAFCSAFSGLNNGTVSAVVASSILITPSNSVGAADTVLWFPFSAEATLTAGAAYAINVGRVDGTTGTTALLMRRMTTALFTPGFRATNLNADAAVGTIAVGTTIVANSTGIGCMGITGHYV